MEKGKEMREEAAKKWGKSFNAAYDRWKVVAKETRAKLKAFCSVGFGSFTKRY